MGLVVNTQKDSQDVASELIYLRDNNYTSSGNVKHSSDFDLSPSQTDHNEIRNEILTRSNANSILGRESEPNKPLTHFLTEEKNYDTLESHNDFSSKNYDPSLRDPDFNTISEPKRSESPRLVGVKSSSAPETLPNKSLPKIDESVLNAKIEKERKQLARDYEQKLQLIKLEHQKKVKEHEIMMIKQSEFDMNSLKDLEKEKQFMAEEVRELENKYKQADQEKLQLKEELSEMRGMMQKYERQQTEYIEKMNQQEEQKTLMNKQYVNFSSYAKQNISNPMDLSMSIVVKDGFKQQANHQDIVIKQEKLDELNNIFDRQKAIKDDDQDSDDEKTQRETVFKLQEYLTDTDDPNEITKPLLLWFLKNKSSQEKNIMLESMTKALSNEDVLLAMTETHFHCLIDVFLKFFSLEKVCMMKYTQGDDSPDEDLIDPNIAKDNIAKIQKNISNLLNSKDYTVIIRSLLKVLKDGLPTDFEKELTEERKQYLKAMTK